MHESIWIFCEEYACIFDGVCKHYAFAGAYIRQVLWTSAYTFACRSLQDVHMRSCVCSLFHLASGNEDGRVQLVYKSTCCLAWGVIVDGRKDRGVVCVFSILNAGGSVCGCMCVYTHTHTHTAQMGYSDVSPGVEMRHLEGPKNPDGLNLGIHIFVYLYKVNMCMYMQGGWMRSWTNRFFHKHIFLPKKKSKRCERNPPIISNLKYQIWAHRPSIKGTKPLSIVLKAIIIKARRVSFAPELLAENS